jgi:Tfp pilus assembly protein PilO
MSFIEKLQNKPRAGAVMAIIIIVWIFSFSHNQSQTKQSTEDMQLPSLFESLGKDFNIFKQGLETNLQSIESESNNLEQQLLQDNEQGE